MIPQMASLAIWRPKLAETFFVPLANAPTFCFRSSWNAFCSACESARVRTCHVV